MVGFVFFSSRRRHTRYWRDWSSDVCSSDLPFNLYLDGGFGLNWTKEKNKATQQTTNLHGWEIGIRPGACVDLTEGLCLCLRIGFAGYRKDYVMGEEPKIGSNGFGILFAPEDLMIGLELEF